MLSIQKCEIPAASLLDKYCSQGAYVDCYHTLVARKVAFPEFIVAFYSTALFKVERWILRWTVARPSTDDEARELANELTKTFAAWHLEARTKNEILLCDLTGRTRSWLRITPVHDAQTRLYFGSAVIPVRNPKTRKLSLGFNFRVLLGFHRVYSALLLYSAKRRIMHISKPINMTNGDSL